MVVRCEDVWRDISDYVDGDIDPILRTAMEEHFRACKRCATVLEGTRNVIELYGDERMCELPLGFSHRLQHRLEEKITPPRRTFLGWMVAAAATVVVAGSIEVARSSVFSHSAPRSEHAQPGNGVPPDMMVVVAKDGKTYHVAGCPFIHDKARLQTITAGEAMREGYTPCVRCMKKYLNS